MASKEAAACRPVPLNPNGFNPKAQIPYGVKPDHVRTAMEQFIDFLGFITGIPTLSPLVTTPATRFCMARKALK